LKNYGIEEHKPSRSKYRRLINKTNNYDKAAPTGLNSATPS
jgi:hypothetical protein